MQLRDSLQHLNMISVQLEMTADLSPLNTTSVITSLIHRRESETRQLKLRIARKLRHEGEHIKDRIFIYNLHIDIFIILVMKSTDGTTWHFIRN